MQVKIYHTWTGGWGDITYWNAYVANLELKDREIFMMRGLMMPNNIPLQPKQVSETNIILHDMVTDKLAALQFYQLAMPAPKAPDSIYNKEELRVE